MRCIWCASRDRVDDGADVPPFDIDNRPVTPGRDEPLQQAARIITLPLLAELLLNECLGDRGECIRTLTCFSKSFTFKFDSGVLAVLDHLKPAARLDASILQGDGAVFAQRAPSGIAAAGEACKERKALARGAHPQDKP